MRKFLLFLGLTLIVGLVGSSVSSKDQSGMDAAQLASAQKSIIELDGALIEQLSRIDSESVTIESLRPLWDSHRMGFVVYNEHRAVDWATNGIPFDTEYDPRQAPKQGVFQMKNSWYLRRTVEAEGQLLVGYALLHTSYDFQNRYIKNTWAPTIGASDRLACTFSSIDSVPIQLTDGESPVGMRILPTDGEVPISWNALFWLAFLILVLITLWYAADWVSGWHSPVLGNAIFVLLLVIIRWLMLWWEQPSAIYALELFGPTHHATSSLLPSLGDFMLNLIWLLCILVRITRTSLKIETSWVNRILGITVPVLLVWPFHFLLEILVINSSFSLDLNHPFSLTFFSILGLVASFLILFNYYLIYRWLFGLVDAKDRSPIRILPPLILGGIALLLLLGFSERFCVLTLIASGLLGILMLSERWMANRIGIYVHTPKVLVFSLLTCSVLIGIESENEQESRIALARSIDEQQNPITEFLFDELADDLLEDRKLRTALSASPLNAENVLSIIHTKLNYDHWNRYLPIVDIYNDEGGLMVSDRERTGPNFFELQSEYDSSKPTISESLRYVGNWDSEGGYLARLEFSGKRSQKNLILFIRLVPERTDDILGFTDLFVDENISTAKDIQGYSYALYNNGELQEQHGNFAYSLSASEYEKFGSENTFIERDGFSHLISKPLEGRIVVVSQASDPYLEYLTTFSYLFLFYLLCTGIASLFSGRLTIGHKDNRSFRNRINIAMSAVSFISLILIGLLTVFYVIDEYHARNEEMISEKSKSVLIELEHKLRDRQSFEESDQAMLSALLVKFSKVFFTDINLYHLDGHLLATSRPRLFDEGLMAKVIHPTAYTEMRFGRKSSFIQEETIGNLSYLTAYVPFRNEKREVIAFMSLPYFARQYGLQQEIFSLLAALTNIYVFLILISVVLALVISNRITEPLRIIRESLKNLKFDQANRAIEWKSNDEIGELVDEYNRTLNELVQSAELLARSERESAWREMAKQVAHEIKNPLTPMKLSIQMLQRSKNDGAEDLDERIDKVSKTLIEQIDTLSNIATEFSSFAQMPKSNIERINLQLLLESVAELYQNSEVDIRLSIQADRPSIIQADKEQMLRVFNNLIKNGIQAVPEDREPTIVIGLIESEGRWIASIKDNGSGIPEELKDKIFVPNFTTKSSGMGLGLAMVKNIVESVNGKISFNSESGAGTTFYVSLSISDH